MSAGESSPRSAPQSPKTNVPDLKPIRFYQLQLQNAALQLALAQAREEPQAGSVSGEMDLQQLFADLQDSMREAMLPENLKAVSDLYGTTGMPQPNNSNFAGSTEPNGAVVGSRGTHQDTHTQDESAASTTSTRKAPPASDDVDDTMLQELSEDGPDDPAGAEPVRTEHDKQRLREAADEIARLEAEWQEGWNELVLFQKQAQARQAERGTRRHTRRLQQEADLDAEEEQQHRRRCAEVRLRVESAWAREARLLAGLEPESESEVESESEEDPEPEVESESEEELNPASPAKKKPRLGDESENTVEEIPDSQPTPPAPSAPSRSPLVEAPVSPAIWRSAREILTRWYNEHSFYPFPAVQEKERLAQETGLALYKVYRWFSAARKRDTKHGNRAIPLSAVPVLGTWMQEHYLRPFPTNQEKAALAQLTELSTEQIGQWFREARQDIDCFCPESTVLATVRSEAWRKNLAAAMSAAQSGATVEVPSPPTTKQRGKLSIDSVEVLHDWLHETRIIHPDKATREQLAQKSGLTSAQVQGWFQGRRGNAASHPFKYAGRCMYCAEKFTK